MAHRTRRHSLLVPFGVTLLMFSALRAAVVEVESKVIVEGTAAAQIRLAITGGENVAAISLPIVVGDGGPVFGGAETVALTYFDLTGSIFDASFSVFVDAGTLPATSATVVNIAILVPDTDVSAQGLLGTLTLDTTMAKSGEVLQIIILDDILSPLSAKNSVGESLSLTIKAGNLRVVPEPFSAFVFVAVPLLTMVIQRRPSVNQRTRYTS